MCFPLMRSASVTVQSSATLALFTLIEFSFRALRASPFEFRKAVASDKQVND